MRRWAAVAAAVAVGVLGVLGGCATPPQALPPIDDRTGSPADPTASPLDDGEGSPDGPTTDPEPMGEVPQECREGFPMAMPDADIADLELMPTDWPAPPAGSTLCTTMGTVGGSTESAGYAVDLPIEDIFAHYENAVQGYETVRTDGTENGTGYATLDGIGAEVDFQIRQREGGFDLLFVSPGSGG